MTWSQLAELRTPPIVATDFLYVRLIGDRSIDKKDFGKIQKDRVIEMKKWSSKVKRVIKQEEGGGRKNIILCWSWSRNHEYIQKDGGVARCQMGQGRGEREGQIIFT